VLNIAEGNGRRAGADRLAFVDTAYSSALKAAVLLDLMVAKEEIPKDFADSGKRKLDRIAGLLFGLRGYCEEACTG
jgi:four helix bundle protein